jgi:hypothetical protein
MMNEQIGFDQPALVPLLDEWRTRTLRSRATTIQSMRESGPDGTRNG